MNIDSSRLLTLLYEQVRLAAAVAWRLLGGPVGGMT